MCKSLRAHGPQCIGWRRMCVGVSWGCKCKSSHHATTHTRGVNKSSQLNCWTVGAAGEKRLAPTPPSGCRSTIDRWIDQWGVC